MQKGRTRAAFFLFSDPSDLALAKGAVHGNVAAHAVKARLNAMPADNGTQGVRALG